MSKRLDTSKMLGSMVGRKPADAVSRLSLLAGEGADESRPSQDVPVSPSVSANVASPPPSNAAIKQSADPRSFAIGEVVELRVDELMEGPYNPRHVYRESREQEIGASMKEHGQKVDLLVYVNSHGQLMVDDGRYRLRGAKRNGIQTLRCRLIEEPGDPLTAFLASREVNLQRNDQTVLDDAFMLKELIRIGQDKAEVVKRMKYDPADVTKLLAIAELPEEIVMTVMREPSLVTKRFLYNLALYRGSTNDSETLRLANEAVQAGMSARDIEARIRTAKQGKRGRPRAAQFEIAEGKAKGYVKSFPAGRVCLDVQGLSPEQQEAVVGRLRSILAASPK